jgi:hypothetical protein
MCKNRTTTPQDSVSGFVHLSSSSSSSTTTTTTTTTFRKGFQSPLSTCVVIWGETTDDAGRMVEEENLKS